MSWNLADARKLAYTRNLRGNAFKGDILRYFDFSTKQYDLAQPRPQDFSGKALGTRLVLAAMLEGREGILLPSNCNMAAQITFCLYLVKRLIVTLRCSVNVTTSFFQHPP